MYADFGNTGWPTNQVYCCRKMFMICVGECYSKVREETEAMRAKMDVNVRLYNVPHSEVAYVYEGDMDDRQKHDGKFIVEMEKPRPEWFPKNLLTKGHGKH